MAEAPDAPELLSALYTGVEEASTAPPGDKSIVSAVPSSASPAAGVVRPPPKTRPDQTPTSRRGRSGEPDRRQAHPPIRRALAVGLGPPLFRRQGVMHLGRYKWCRRHALPGDMARDGHSTMSS